MDSVLQRYAARKSYRPGSYPDVERWGFFKEDVSQSFWNTIISREITESSHEIDFYNYLETQPEKEFMLVEYKGRILSLMSEQIFPIMHSYVTAEDDIEILYKIYNLQFGLHLDILFRHLEKNYLAWASEQYIMTRPLPQDIPDFSSLSLQDRPKYIDCDWFLEDIHGVVCIDQDGNVLHSDDEKSSMEYRPTSPDYDPQSAPPSPENSSGVELAHAPQSHDEDGSQSAVEQTIIVETPAPVIIDDASSSCSLQLGGEVHSKDQEMIFQGNIPDDSYLAPYVDFLENWPTEMRTSSFSASFPEVKVIPKVAPLSYEQLTALMLVELRKSRRYSLRSGKASRVTFKVPEPPDQISHEKRKNARFK